jgi:hypothetical protein
LERRRRRLLDLIVTDPPVSREAIADLARAAGWALPRRVAVVALQDRGQDHFGPLPALPPDVLIDVARQDPCVLVPDPDGPGRAEVIERGLRGWTGAVGAAVPLGRATSSLRWGRQMLALARLGAVAGEAGLIRCEEHLATLMLSADEELARVLSAVRLAPLAGLRQIQELFGPVLTEPGTRFELEVALRARALLGSRAPGSRGSPPRHYPPQGGA